MQGFCLSKICMEEKMISVIVPIYNGRKYIPNLIRMIERNAENICCAVELILVNDSPQINIDDLVNSSVIKIISISNKKNMGIHYSRVHGISHSHGEFILMLDQDDEINDNFLISQLSKIGKADMIISNGYIESDSEKLILYRFRIVQWTAKHLLFHIIFGNRITSPGQCLIKKKCIPEIWFKRIVKNNGADDYLLWMLVLYNGAKIKINPETIYTHCFVGSNASMNSEAMNASVAEILEIVKANTKMRKSSYKFIKNRLSGKKTLIYKIIDILQKINDNIKRKY